MVFFTTCGPNEAMVVSGMCHSKPLYIVGGRTWIWPIIQQKQMINLNTMTLEVVSPRVYTKLGVPISVTGVAQIKIPGQNEEMLATACQQLLNKSDIQIQRLALETVEAHQRAIMGLLTVEEIFQDRTKFSEKVFEVSSSDLVNMGITVVSYTIKDIRDDAGYLHALGAGRTAEVKRDARIGEAEASKQARIREADAEEKRLHAKYFNDTQIANSKRDYEVEKATYDQEVNATKATANLAYQLQAAKTNQSIKEEEMSVRVIERTQQIALQEQEIARRERELDATIKRPAEAEKYRLEKIAEAEKQRRILEAQGRAESEKLRGEAEAFAIQAKATAEAEQMKKKAEAWQDYKDAAMVDMVLEALPMIAAEVAAPLAKGVQKVTMVSTGDGDVGAAKLTNEVMEIMGKLPEMVKNMTGVDISKAMNIKTK